MRTLIAGFHDSLQAFPSREALVVDGEALTYAKLAGLVGALKACLLDGEDAPQPLVGILAHRSKAAYAGLLAALAAGKGYVPLNPKFPVERLRKVLNLSRVETLVVGKEGLPLLEPLLARSERRITAVFLDPELASSLAGKPNGHRVLAAAGEVDRAGGGPVPADPDSTAYLLFTSGSTGEPKGVPVSHRNVRGYLDLVCREYQVRETDRFSQMFDLSFDLSVHDMFLCWEKGACLYSVPERYLMAPIKFIRDHQLTMWFSVPSTVGLSLKMRLLKPGCLPTLRYSLFCGEPLPAAYAQGWQQAAPASVLENLYGPTETTIAISSYRWDDRRSPGECVNGIVPIGRVFDGQRHRVVREGSAVPEGEPGELCLSGSQVTRGYWNDPVRTAESYVVFPDAGPALWYRTGDLVREGPGGCLFYLGRMDNQVKIRGFRVELQEVDWVVTSAAAAQRVVSYAWPVRDGSAEGIISVVSGGDRDQERVLGYCRERLPDYMVPRRLIHVDDIPLNPNGKVDRKKLFERIRRDHQL